MRRDHSNANAADSSFKFLLLGFMNLKLMLNVLKESFMVFKCELMDINIVAYPFHKVSKFESI